MVMIAPLDKGTKNHWTVHLKWVNFMICKTYFKKGMKKIKKLL